MSYPKSINLVMGRSGHCSVLVFSFLYVPSLHQTIRRLFSSVFLGAWFLPSCWGHKAGACFGIQKQAPVV